MTDPGDIGSNVVNHFYVSRVNATLGIYNSALNTYWPLPFALIVVC